MSGPHISIVAVGRNDDYGGDFRQRLQTFVSWTVKQLSEHRISSELIFVNYNPLDTGEPIEEFINWPRSDEWVTVRVVTVPPQVHNEFVDLNKVKAVPVLEYLAKNVGIRRSNGDFVLVMNPDIILSRNLFGSLLNVSPKRYYRANRIDFNGIDFDLNGYRPTVQLRSSAFRIWFKGQPSDINEFSWNGYLWKWAVNACINRWRLITVHLRPLLDFLSIPVYYDRLEYRYHCNASGDLMMMSRENWMRLRGYDEGSWISLHVDSLMVLQAAFSGLKEKTFLHPIFHKEHARRYDARIREKNDQEEAYNRFRGNVERLVKEKTLADHNTTDWGLGNLNLPEVRM